MYRKTGQLLKLQRAQYHDINVEHTKEKHFGYIVISSLI